MDIRSNFALPLVPVIQQFFFIVKQLFMSFGGELEIRTLDDGIDGTRFLAKPAVDAFCHIDVVSRRPARTVLSLFRFNRYCL